MLFNSEIFIFIFLPFTLLGFFQFAKYQYHRIAIAWLVLASFIFYGWFRVDYLVLLSVLIVINYALGMKLSRQYQSGKQSRLFLTFGILINLGVLFYFKYTHFFLANVNAVFHTNYFLDKIILPIGISFFIFQKIAYLVDAYKGEAKEYNFLDFCLFVMFFPQLIAGPIVHHKELIPQFRNPAIFTFNAADMATGIIMFSIGLAKKTLIADQISRWVEPAFSAAEQGWHLSFIESWAAILGFTFQIYFDFSAYSDMALGLALMMGIRLPLNFNSPYQAENIIDFWRRWHISLSNFLRDYIYIPLGGNKKGTVRRFINLMLTMLIGGFWHGASWTFLAWGALHGFYLIVNHGYQSFKKKMGFGLVPASALSRFWSRGLTFLAVIIAWIFFRAETFKGAMIILKGMIGLNGLALPTIWEAKLPSTLIPIIKNLGVRFDPASLAYVTGSKQIVFLFAVLLVLWFLPNTQQICAEFQPAFKAIKPITLNRFWARIPFIHLPNRQNLAIVASPLLGVALAVLVFAIMLWHIARDTPLQNFIYFQF